jgi:hypothetical protein
LQLSQERDLKSSGNDVITPPSCVKGDWLPE